MKIRTLPGVHALLKHAILIAPPIDELRVEPSFFGKLYLPLAEGERYRSLPEDLIYTRKELRKFQLELQAIRTQLEADRAELNHEGVVENALAAAGGMGDVGSGLTTRQPKFDTLREQFMSHQHEEQELESDTRFCRMLIENHIKRQVEDAPEGYHHTVRIHDGLLVIATVKNETIGGRRTIDGPPYDSVEFPEAASLCHTDGQIGRPDDDPLFPSS